MNIVLDLLCQDLSAMFHFLPFLPRYAYVLASLVETGMIEIGSISVRGTLNVY